MAVARDAVVNGSPFYDQDSVSHTVSSGSDRYLLVSNLYWGWTDGITAISYGGVALTQVVSHTHSHGGNNVILTVWELKAPATGANSVVWDLSFSARRYGAVHSYTGVDQTTAYDNTGSDKDNNHGHTYSLTAQTAGLITTMQGCVCVGFSATGDSTLWKQDNRHSVNYNEAFDGAAKTMSGNGSDCGERPHVSYGLTLQPPQNITVDMTGSEAIVATSASVGTVIEGNNVDIIGRTASVVATARIGAAVVDEPIRGDMIIVAGD